MATTTTTLPAGLTAGIWNIDPNHSSVGFVARHLMVTKVRGSFTKFNGTITVADDVVSSHAEVEIDTTSINTGAGDRDAHLKSADFFDVEKYPTMTFRSTGVRPSKGEDFQLVGDLTLHGQSRPITLDVTYEGTAKDPWGGTRASFSATADINRKDWGLEFNVTLETGGLLVSDKIKLELEVQAIKQ